MIVFENAEVRRPDGSGIILEPVTLRLSESLISIIGLNGSGKSTLARMMNGLVVPDTGRVLVLDPVSNDWLDTARKGSAVRRTVGFSFTDPAAQLIMPTVIEDIALSLRREYKQKADRLAAAHTVLDRFGLADLADRSVHQLSGGQRQLVALASVLATDPAVLVADEPTTLLDLRNTRMIGDLLYTLPQQTFIVTHNLELAARAERTLVVHEGRIAFDGTPTEAIAHYRELAG
ncbi:ABC transporter ATP-binding protein [Leucobacter sp. cx-42]|uniref:energy-coupling factor ABC transporter ATP-binding protein n=1 Tax=unclassified Leucobacter TaxID=2621730 RepID=UPI00165EADAB|nr:ABC transporter ATP-binding protein [Leucobacter sp. cx-42]